VNFVFLAFSIFIEKGEKTRYIKKREGPKYLPYHDLKVCLIDRDQQVLQCKYTIISAENASVLSFFCKKILFSPKKGELFVNYNDYEQHFSKPRLDKYKRACGGNEQKALDLYLLNIETSKKFYGVLSLFEVALRNAIDRHYQKHFNDDCWMLSNIDKEFFTSHQKMAFCKEKNKFNKFGYYCHDKIVAALSLGFWTDMFSYHSFFCGNKTLLKIFTNKEKGANQKSIFKELDRIRIFRNRISHHEPICFNESGKVSEKYVEIIWNLIQKYINFLGLPNDFLQNIETPTSDIEKLRAFFVE